MRSILRKAWLAGFALTAGFAGCADLSEMEEGYCGNGVVEPEYGEDCDNFPYETCIGPGEKNECRLDCSPSGDNDERPACPTGWGCALDNLCRQSDGTYDEKGAVSLEDAPKLAVADVDGDRRMDLIAVTTQEMIVSFFDNDGNVAESAHRYSFPTAPSVGQLTSGDSPPDIVLLAEGLTVLVGGKDRALQPTAYAPFSVDSPSAKAVVMEAMPMGLDASNPGKWVGEEIIVLTDGLAKYIGRWSEDDLMDMSEQMDGLSFAGDPLVGHLNPEWPCDDLVLAFQGAKSIVRYNPCAYDSDDHFGWNHTHYSEAVEVPDGKQIATPALLVDVNLDGLIDVVVGVTSAGVGPEEAIWKALPVVAYGVGDGTFNSEPPPAPPDPPPDPPEPPVPGNGKTAWLTLPETPGFPRDEMPQMPLAMGDVNGDGVMDFVMRDAILVSIQGWGPKAAQTPVFGALASNDGYLWDQGVIADFNANRFPDVIVGSSDEQGITFYNGTGTGLFNEFWLSTQGYPAHFTVGDFDGDLVNDLAYAETNVETAAGVQPGDALSVVFGEGFGGPSEPVTMGYLGSIEQIGAGSMAAFHLDDIDDLIVVSKPKGADNVTIAALGGSSDRQLLSPFILSDGPADEQPLEMAPWLAVVGEFDGDTGHADIATIGIAASELTGPESLLDLDTRLWLVPSSGEAAINSELDRPSDRIPYGFLGTQAAMVPIDLDDDGVDEVVVLGTAVDFASESFGGRAYIARSASVDKAHAFTLEEAGTTSVVYWQALGGLTLQSVVADMTGDADAIDGTEDHIGTHIVTGDVDGDDEHELVTLGYGVDLSTATITSHVQLIEPDGHGGLDMGGITNLTDGVIEAPTGIALANLDGDVALELVIVTEDEAYTADVEGGGLRNVKLLEDVDGGFSVAAADFTGDGVVDIAVGHDGGVILYKGNPVNP